MKRRKILLRLWDDWGYNAETREFTQRTARVVTKDNKMVLIMVCDTYGLLSRNIIPVVY